jgi:recombination protein RecT
MPDEARTPARPTGQQLETMPFADAFEAFTPELETALPDHIPVDRFKRVVITAINNSTPHNNLAAADRRSLFTACVKCAVDGLYPDGREAALVVYNTKIKDKNGREHWVPLVQYMPMVQGIRKRMRNTGEVLSADAQLVFRNDKFHYEFGDDPKLIHEPPPLGQTRGEIIGAYSIIKLANGEILREVMDVPGLERVRSFSKTKDGPAWRDHKSEMYRKTVLRRNSKAAPTGSDLERMLSRDDETPEIEHSSPVRRPIPPRPRLADYQAGPTEQPEPPPPDEDEPEVEAKTWTLVTPDGELLDFDSTTEAATALADLMASVRPRGLAAVEAVWIDHRTLLEQLQDDNPAAADMIAKAYEDARDSFAAAPDDPAQAPAVARPSSVPAAGAPPRRRGRPTRSSAPAAIRAAPAVPDVSARRPIEPPEPEVERDRDLVEEELIEEEFVEEELIEEEYPSEEKTAPLPPAMEDPDPPALVPHDPTKNILEWFARGQQRLWTMHEREVPRDRFTAYRKANFAALERLRREIRSYSVTIETMIADGERGAYRKRPGVAGRD